MQDIIDYATKKNASRIECEAIDVLGRVNSEKLLIKFNFIKKETIDNYWGILYPEFYCKECNHKPCICSMHKHIKRLN